METQQDPEPSVASVQENLYRELSPRFFINRYPSKQQFELYIDLLSNQQKLSKNLKNQFKDFIDKFDEQDYQISVIFGDFLYQIFCFCVENKFNYEKTSCLVELSANVLYQLHVNQMNEADSFKLFTDYLIRHSLFRPPWSIKLFDLQEVKQINNFFIYTIYNNFALYHFVFTPNMNYELNTFNMFKSRFPFVEDLNNGQQIERKEIQLLNEYMIDKETGLTPEQLEEIMRGDSIHQVPESKKQEWIRLKKERDMQRKLEKAILKQKIRLNEEFECKVKNQDQIFLEEIKSKKK